MRSAYNILYLLIFFLLGFFTACSQAGSHEKEEAVGSSVVSDFHFAGLTPAQKQYYRGRVEAAYHSILGPAFNGSILVAKNGEIVFEDYRGYADFRTKEPISASTPFHLASVSKTFTGTTVLKLWQQGRLSLDDTLQHFFPELPYHGITVRMLLCHRSGLPNYLYFFDSCWNK